VLPLTGDAYSISAPPRPRKHGLKLSLRDDDSLWREPWWNADRRARPQRRVGASRPLRGANRTRWCGHETLRLSAFHFLIFFFVARIKRSEIRELNRSVTFVPGFRSAHPGYGLFDIAACKTCAHWRRGNDIARVMQSFAFPQGKRAQYDVAA